MEKTSNNEIINKLKALQPDEFVTVINVRNGEGSTLLEVVKTNKNKNISNELLQILRETASIPKSKYDQFSALKMGAEVHIQFSKLYLPKLRSCSLLSGSEKNPYSWVTLKEGSYYLGNAYNLVRTYKMYMRGKIEDKNIQKINAALVSLEFHPNHISSGYTDEAYGGEAICFVSKGQGTAYYKLLHSDLKKDVRLFIEMVERDIDVPVKSFLESVERKLPSLLPEKLFEAIESNDHLEVEYCIKNGVNINLYNKYGRTPLYCAVYNGNVGIIRVLLSNEADATYITNEGTTLLHIAASKGYKKVVETLLKHLNNQGEMNLINTKTTEKGITALHIAAKNGSLEIVRSLLKYGAIYNIKNKEDKTPIELSEDQDVIDLLKLVEDLFEDAKKTTSNNKLQWVD